MRGHTRYRELLDRHRALRAERLCLNMARGKPGQEQLALSMPMLDVLGTQSGCFAADGTDCRNYGALPGIAEARALFGEYMGVPAEQVLVGGASSLTLMYDCLARAMLRGVRGSARPWGSGEAKFLCPVPGYDRHFAICEFLGIGMIPVPMDEHGPDLDEVERLAGSDATVKGIWCVPKFSNPLGVTYSDEVVRRLAAMKTAAPDFRIFWDNAYALHFLEEDVPLGNILDACTAAGHPDRPYLFGSTSKITFPGAGLAFFAASPGNVAFTLEQMAHQAIGWDKLNMLRHVRFFGDMEGVRAQMQRHAAILKPRFAIVLYALDRELVGRGIGSCTRPRGGYFVTYRAPPGCAKRIVALCREAGVTLTAAGATHPYGHDPEDSVLRIAPSYPSPIELERAMEVFCVAAELAALERGLAHPARKPLDDQPSLEAGA